MLKKCNLAIAYSVLTILTCFKSSLAAVPVPSAAAQQAAFRDVHTAINALKYSTHNHELELQQASERFQNIEEMLSAVRRELNAQQQQQNEQLHTKTCDLKLKVHAVESDVQKLSSDIQQMRDLVKESLATLAQHKKLLDTLVQRESVREKNVEHLQTALHSLMEAMQLPEASKKAETYRVKSGDTLEKIAMARKTSVKVLKELNGLLTDRIREGQELKLPEP